VSPATGLDIWGGGEKKKRKKEKLLILLEIKKQIPRPSLSMTSSFDI
jgi:hypothetical protein